MKANFLLFPAPKCESVSSVSQHIYLLPKDDLSLHIPYLQQQQDELKRFFEQHCNGNEEDKKRMRQSNISVRKQSFLRSNLQELKKVDCRLQIPCIFLRGRSSNRLMLYFHANGEDICLTTPLLMTIVEEVGCCLLAMEYRGYSIAEGEKSPENIQEDAYSIMEYLLRRKIREESIAVWGRSIGCAVGMSVAVKYKLIHSLILLSPFYSLKKVARELYGQCAGHLVEESFQNQQNTLQIQCPVLLIHGMKDTLVSYQHSLSILAGLKCYTTLKLVQDMTHTRFHFKKDFINNVIEFFYAIL